MLPAARQQPEQAAARKPALGLRARVLLLVVAIVVPAVALMTYTAHVQRQHTAWMVQDKALDFVRALAAQHGTLVARAQELLVAIAQFPSVRNRGEEAECHRILSGMRPAYAHYANFGVARLDGEVVCSALPLRRRVDISDRPYFRRALATRRLAVGEYQIGRITGTQTINLAYPVLDERGTPLAAVFAALDLAWLNRTLTKIALPANSVLTLIDGEQTIIARYPPSPAQPVGSRYTHEAVERAGQARAEGLVEAADRDGVSRIYAFTRLHESAGGRVSAILAVNAATAYAEVDRIFARNLVLLLAFALLVSIAALKGADRLVLRRVNALAAATRDLEHGNLGARSGLARGEDEIGALARAFDQMAGTLERRAREIETANRALHRTNRALATLSGSNRTLLNALDEPSLLHEMCRVAVEAGSYRMAWIGYAQDDAGRSVRPMAHAGHDDGYLAQLAVSWADVPRGRGPAGTAVRTNQACVVDDIETDPRFEPWRAEARRRGYASMIALPLRFEGERGVLAIYAAEAGAFGSNELALFEEMADDISFGITTLRNRVRQHEAEEHVRRMAYTDFLTGLGSRVHFEERLQEHIARVRREGGSFAVLHLDLERFREINSAVGHAAGDQLLRQVAERLREALDEPVALARLGADEFGVLLPDSGAEHAIGLARSLCQALDRPFAVAGLSVDLQTNVGIALYPAHGEDVRTLLRLAAHAGDEARRAPEGIALHVPGTEQDVARRLTLATDLRRAIENGELSLYCQPKLDIAAGRITGAEALARWSHPQQGMISPAEFIPLAEHTGLIRPLSYWALETAARQLSAWRKAHEKLALAVNLSARNLRDPELLERVDRYVTAWGIEPQWLELEITESALMEDPEGAREVLRRLRAKGFRLYIDDFGTGYSSLAYLKRLPLTAIKIDKSFVADMVGNGDSARIVRSTIGLAHDMGLKVVAEGVENEATLAALRRLGCDSAQGYFLAQPLPAGEFLGWLAASPWRAAHKRRGKAPGALRAPHCRTRRSS
jgi:diguanylate cyclase (GGDEF)-like protein